uniref:Flavin-containing monooxygenase n=1 Tax=Acrobeloides nanus TaxID=290746 RepID=A0A914CC84_9BILA
MNLKKLRVAIIGAGASGLPSARHALLYNIEPVIFDTSDDIGGLWRYKPYETEEPSVMKSTVINTSKEMTAYSDFPPPDDFPNFMHQSKMYEYFQMYAENFGLLPYIRFKHKVIGVERAGSYEENGRWKVTYLDSQDIKQVEEFDGILLACGHHGIPYIPDPWPGQEKFQGKIIHAHSYKDLAGYEDKVVAVVGIGNSACDIAVDISRVAKQVYLSTRRGTWLFFRLLNYGNPFDLAPNSRFQTIVKSYIPSKVYAKWTEYKLQKCFDHEKYGLKPKHGPFGAHTTVNDELPNRLACGKVILKPNVSSFTENGIKFTDGTEIKHIDNVILSTGYSFNFDIVEKGNLIKVEENKVELYQYMYPPDLCEHNTLAVIGLVQGNILPLSEMQARVYFDVLSGNSKLPLKFQMLEDIEAKSRAMKERFVESRRHTIQVNHVAYMDGLADLIGCKPKWKDYILSDHMLAYKLLFGPSAAYTYRLNGPKPWTGARKAVLELDKRVSNGMNPNSMMTTSRNIEIFSPAYIILVNTQISL